MALPRQPWSSSARHGPGLCAIVFLLGGCASVHPVDPASSFVPGEAQLRIGDYSFALTVKHLGASRMPYVRLGLRSSGRTTTLGDPGNTAAVQRMLDQGRMRLDPGWILTGGSWPGFDEGHDAEWPSRRLALAADGTAAGTASPGLVDPAGTPTDQPAPGPPEPPGP